jgi:hypothetical protein
MVSIYLSNETSFPHVEFGGYNPDLVKGGDSGIAWLDITNETEWQTTVTAGYFGDQ